MGVPIEESEMVLRGARAIMVVVGKGKHGSTEFARAVIEAMREPTEAMVDATFAVADAVIRREDLRDSYRTMIDAALK